jgi:hypothetical protein
MAEEIVKGTIATANSEHALAIPAGHTSCKLINSSDHAIYWSPRQNISLGHYVLPARTVLKHDLPGNGSASTIFWQSNFVGDVLNVKLI